VLTPIRGAAAVRPGDGGGPLFVSSADLPDAADTGIGTLICGPQDEDGERTASRKAGLTAAVDVVLGRNIVPSCHVYILPTLQMADSDDQVTPSISSIGHYYE
jgi:hypothetical protein